MNINRLIVGGCNDGGCTRVLSQQFKTLGKEDFIFIIFE
jgi:hypothetical protein